MSRLFTFLLLTICFVGSALAEDTPAFREVAGDLSLQFPKDHGAHPEFATEWWYFTGHLKAADSRAFGFELVFFRIGAQPVVDSKSAWALQSVYLAHFALTDDKAGAFKFWERKSRGSFSQAGASETGLKVWNGPWRAELEDDQLTVHAAADDTALDLELRATKPIVLHGENGLSKKGPEPGDASYYSSFTKMLGSGSLKTHGQTFTALIASAWFDHEFTSTKHARGSLGWDWFAIQLENGEELMVYQLREADGSKSKYSSGTFINRDGIASHLNADQFSIEPLATWKSERTGVQYPSKWKLVVPSLALEGEVEPTVAAQELVTSTTTGVTYWEGRSLFRGTEGGEPRKGDVYVELVGYGKK